MPAIEPRAIANLLGEAGAAHGGYEERDLNGVYDRTGRPGTRYISSSTGLRLPPELRCMVG